MNGISNIPPSIPVLLIIGPVGVGKSSVAVEISETLSDQKISHAMIDLDYLRYAYQESADDPYNMNLGYKNLADVVQNNLRVGVTRFVIPSVIEDAMDIEKIKEIIPNSNIIVVQLQGNLGTIEKNLKTRESGKRLEWHLQRAEELTELLRVSKLGDIIVDIDNKSVQQIALEVIEASHL